MLTSSQSALLSLLGTLMRQDSEGLDTSTAAQLDPEEVKKHRLAALAHQRGLEGYRDDFIRYALASEFWIRALGEVLSVFDAAGIDACRLKGCAYFVDLYEDPAERPMGDLDILVRPEQFDEARRALETLGFSTRPDKEFVFAPSHHALTFDRHPITVDLHRSMMQQGRSQIDIEGIWSRADTHDHRPAPLDEIVLHLCHIIRSELMVPLVSFVDLALLLRRGEFPRSVILARCDEFRVGRGARVVFALYDQLKRGNAGQPVPYPLPGIGDLVRTRPLNRARQLVVKAMLVDGLREVAGLALTTLRERSRRWD